jgi:hypothetical protein
VNWAVTEAPRGVSRKTMKYSMNFSRIPEHHDLKFTTSDYPKTSCRLFKFLLNFTWLGLQSDETKVQKELLLAGLCTAEWAEATVSSTLWSTVSTQIKHLHLPTQSGSVYPATPSVCMWHTETFLRPELLPKSVISFTSSSGVAAAPWMKTVSPGKRPYVGIL